jgi:hypothetical protein
MKLGRLLLASAVLFVVGLAWNGFFHLVVLRRAELAMVQLLRPDAGERVWLSVFGTAALVVLFLLGYGRVARRGSFGEGIAYGLFFAAVAGLLVDLNQYVLYPIPAPLAAAWFAGGVFEFALYGALASRLCGPVGRAS